jgi:hypothetical protein
VLIVLLMGVLRLRGDLRLEIARSGTNVLRTSYHPV